MFSIAAFLSIFLLGCGPKLAKLQPILRPRVLNKEKKLRLLSYNIKGLPSMFASDNRSEKISQISPLLNAFDLSLIQENFWHDTELQQKSRLPFQMHGTVATGEWSLVGSGLASFSAYPIEPLVSEEWMDCGGYWTGENDCMAEKGFQAFRIPLDPDNPDKSIHVYNLHMDAGDLISDQWVRTRQVIQLIKALKRISSDQAVIVVGDFNMKPEKTKMFLDKLSMGQLLRHARLYDACAVVNCPSPNELDRVLYRGSKHVRLSPLLWEKVAGFVDEKGKSLSDHPPISVEFLVEAVD